MTDPHDGKLVVSPSYSPEHGPFTAGAAMSQQIVADLFANTVGGRAAGRATRSSRKRVDDALAKLDPRPARRQVGASCRNGRRTSTT